MAITHIFGSDYVVAIKKEVTYGTNPGTLATGGAILPDKFEFAQGVERIELTGKTGLVEKSSAEMVSGRNMPTITLSGQLSPACWMLIQAITDSSKAIPADSPASFETDITTRAPNSYTIAQVFRAGDKSGYGRIATACVCKSLKISIAASGAITYQAQFDCQDIDQSYSSITGTFTPTLHIPVAQSGDVTAVSLSCDGLTGSLTEILSADIEVTRTATDDDSSFGLSFTRQLMITQQLGGTATITAMHDAAVGVPTTNGIATFVATVTMGSHAWGLSAHGVVDNPTLADPDNGYYRHEFPLTLANNNGDAAFSCSAEVTG